MISRLAPVAVDELIETHGHVVRIYARKQMRLLPRSALVSFDEMVSCGNVGLCKAAKRFEPSRDLLFSSYAGKLIAGHMVDYLRSLDLLTRHERRKARLTQMQTGEGPVRLMVSLEAARHRADGDRGHAQAEASMDVKDLLARIKPRLAQTLRLYYLDDISLPAIAVMMGISRGRVSQLLRMGLSEALSSAWRTRNAKPN